VRIARWRHGGAVGEGFVVDDTVIGFPDGITVAEILARGVESARVLHARVDAADGVPLAEVELLPPVVPPAIRDFVAFEEHVEGISATVDGQSEVVPEWYEAPTFYFTNPHTLRATGETVPVPETQRLDFELEVAAVIGGVPRSDGRNLTVPDAAAHVFGYTIMNDWSARDLQSREMKVRLGPCKGKDFATTLGPWIVTADEVADLMDEEGFLALRAEVSVNGVRVGEDLVSNMGWPFAELVAYASRNSRVVPGDVLGSGTVGNGGCLGELWGRGSDLPALQPGDEVRMVVERLGEIVNTVGPREAAPPIPPARPRTRARRR
jgi:2-keto-4-pentenoate hydratase/2-oxohepta-3-ene-1,7-dioic acid hydratase in catechol pathway